MHKVELDQFQGPLDLLLYFIRRDEIDIYDIPIAKITAEYLQIIEDMKSMNLSIAGAQWPHQAHHGSGHPVVGA